MRLYSVYLGGGHPKANIELHDVVFTLADSLEELFPKLKKLWFGFPETHPHVDSYIEMEVVDGYRISVVPKESSDCPLKLFFLNFGGYSEGLFGEHHENAFYVAASKAT